MSTKVIDETALRIKFPKAPNIEPVTQDLPFSTTTSSTSIVAERAIEVKDKEEAINTQGFSLWLIIYHPDVLRCILDKCLEKILFFVKLPNKKTSPPLSTLSESYEVDTMSSTSSGLKGILDINTLFQM